MSLSTLQTLRITVAALRQVTEETQGQLAAGIGLTQEKVSRRQSGATVWTLDDVDALAAHWGLDVLDLLAGPTRATEAYSTRHRPGPAATAQPLPATFAAATPTPLPAAAPAPAKRPRSTAPAPAPTPLPVEAPTPAAAAPAPVVPVVLDVAVELDRDLDGQLLLTDPAPCVRCGRPTPYRAGGRPLHAGGWCTPAAPVEPAGLADAAQQAMQAAVAPDSAPTAAAGPTAPAGLAERAQQAAQAVLGQPPAPAQAEDEPAAVKDEPAPAEQEPTAAPTPPAPAAPAIPAAGAPVRKEPATLAELLDLIRRPVERELARHGGDVDAATAALVKKAIPDAMALLAVSRVGARYEHTDHPPLPDILKKASKASADQVWEARPKWKNTALIKSTETELTVSALDMNGAYLSALKSHLPIGKLSHDTSGRWDPRQAGLYLVTPPAWDHPDLPNPLGSRDEAGPLWLTSSTMRMLQRLAGPKLGLCEAPVIHEAWTAYSTENILENFRQALGSARDTAIAEHDAVTLEYVKAMYSKFVSTIGLSTANHKMKRPDWMHIIRAQAFANLWWKGLKARDAGLTIVQMMGTDELHLVGDWRSVFPEGRKVTEVKLKDTYTIGGGK
ncbi:hypothetical protein [Kitasatospora herbaricolor]|uniref:BetR domain-containing protein n=1 Tax=Kitasatospora herbaricolor TaxID=68217 RepID=A0ABZ1WMF3_9ACTN|nr:hypothetical protein [Kitasatospora herbaricolor]